MRNVEGESSILPLRVHDPSSILENVCLAELSAGGSDDLMYFFVDRLISVQLPVSFLSARVSSLRACKIPEIGERFLNLKSYRTTSLFLSRFSAIAVFDSRLCNAAEGGLGGLIIYPTALCLEVDIFQSTVPWMELCSRM